MSTQNMGNFGRWRGITVSAWVIWYHGGMSSTRRLGHKPHADGNYATPIWAVSAILPHLPISKRIIDPCAGSGNILRALADEYPNSIESLTGIELNGARAALLPSITGVTGVHGNGLHLDWGTPDLVVMNPPFSLQEVFTRRALNFVGQTGTVAVLLKQSFSAGIARRAFWTNKVADMFVLPKRPSFEKRAKSSQDSCEYAWFMFGPHATGKWQRLELDLGGCDEED